MKDDKTIQLKANAFKEQLFEDMASKLAEHGFTGEQAWKFVMGFDSRLYSFTSRVLEPVSAELNKMTMAKYLEKEAEIKKLFDQVLSDLRLLTGQGACEDDQPGK